MHPTERSVRGFVYDVHTGALREVVQIEVALTGLGQALEGRPHGTRTCVLYPGAMATSWGTWTPGEHGGADDRTRTEALAPEAVADPIVWVAAAPRELVLNEATVSPLREQGWP